VNLNCLIPGDFGIIEKVNGEGALRRRLLDMGLTPKTLVTVRKVAPFGDPMEITLRGYELTIRKEDACMIEMKINEELCHKRNCQPCGYGKSHRYGKTCRYSQVGKVIPS